MHRESKGFLAGSSKIGKTWILLNLAVAVATGGRFLNWNAIRGRVLFINFEISRAFICQRLKTVMENRGLTVLENLDVWTLRGQDISAENFLPALIEKVRSAGYSLIVIDPVYKLLVGRSESSGSAVGLLVQKLERLMARSGAAIVIAHHFTKGPQANKKAIDRMSGSGVFARDADTVVTFTEHKLEGCFVVETIQRNMAITEPFVVEWNCPSMVMRDDLDPTELHDGKKINDSGTSELLLSLLREQGLTTTAWEQAAQEAGIPHATFFRHKAKLKKNGEVEQDSSTKVWYRPVPPVVGDTRET